MLKISKRKVVFCKDNSFLGETVDGIGIIW